MSGLEQQPTFQIRISRMIDGKSVRTYLDVQAENEVEALNKVIDALRKRSQQQYGGR